jgi:hypothetical protein
MNAGTCAASPQENFDERRNPEQTAFAVPYQISGSSGLSVLFIPIRFQQKANCCHAAAGAISMRNFSK